MKEYTNSASFSEASQLKKFVATNFVVAHIESDKTNGKQALEKVGVDTSKIYAVPAIIGLNKEGKYSGEIPPASLIEGLEVRESGGQEYRGYNRLILLEQLKQLRNKSK